MQKSKVGHRRKRVAVIGAGSSGLVAIKCCKEEHIDVVCYEKTSVLGGLWHYHEEDSDGLASVMKSTVINTSKELSAFSDFPPPKEFANYMHNKQMLRYFHMYAENFGLYDHIQYNREVIQVVKAGDYDATGRWVVSVRDTKENAVSEDVFDGVMVCIGHHVQPHVPYFQGQEEFRGKIIHSHSLKTPDAYKDQNVLVVGVGNSGLDAAVDISNVANQVYLSTRHGCWILHKVGYNGLPMDMHYITRLYNLLFNFLNWNMASRYIETFALDNVKFNHSLFSLKPKHRLFSQHGTVNDFLPQKIITGIIKIKKNLKMFTQKGVIFEEENSVTAIDAVVLATGYTIQFPFLDENLISTTNNKVDLYKLAFPPRLKHPSLVFIGLIQPHGSIFPIAESQSRWYALLMNGKVHLPDVLTMDESIRNRRKATEERFVRSPRHTLQVDFVNFMDELAEGYGVKPNLFKYFISDPKLFRTCLLGPCLPYQYRLQGPHSWTGARDALLKFPERVVYPLNGGERKYHYQYFNEKFVLCGYVLIFLVVVWSLVAIFKIYYND